MDRRLKYYTSSLMKSYKQYGEKTDHSKGNNSMTLKQAIITMQVLQKILRQKLPGIISNNLQNKKYKVLAAV